MTRQTRTRTRVTPPYVGTTTGWWNGSVNYSNLDDPSWVLFQREVCQDSHGRPVVPSPLTITRRDFRFIAPYNGVLNWPGPPYRVELDNVMPGQVKLDQSIVSVGNIPTEGESMTTLLARTNPSRPEVTPLTLIQDLVDIPKMLKEVGKLSRTPRRKLSSRDAANQFLGAKFGWLPLIQDVKDLLNLQRSILRRKDELHRLYQAGGLKRRLRLGNWSGSLDGSNTALYTTSWAVHYGIPFTIARVQRWGTVRWLPTVLPPHNPTDHELNEQARRLAAGISVQGTVLGGWDLVPWSWIIEWFVNLKEFASTYSSSVPAVPTEACIMTHRHQIRSWRTTQQTIGMTGGEGFDVYETKSRYVGEPTLNAHIPFLDRDRLAILGALFVQRFKRN